MKNSITRNFLRNIFSVILILSSINYFSNLAHSQEVKIITLKDGSVLKGEVVELQNHTYRIKTSNLGEVQINDNDILSIATNISSINQQPSTSNSIPPNNYQPSPLLKQQTEQIQGKIMADPQLMGDITELIKDPEIVGLLSDPAFMKDIMSYDQEKMKSNPKLQELMQNPKFMELINKLAQKVMPPPSSEPSEENNN